MQTLIFIIKRIDVGPVPIYLQYRDQRQKLLIFLEILSVSATVNKPLHQIRKRSVDCPLKKSRRFVASERDEVNFLKVLGVCN